MIRSLKARPHEAFFVSVSVKLYTWSPSTWSFFRQNERTRFNEHQISQIYDDCPETGKVWSLYLHTFPVVNLTDHRKSKIYDVHDTSWYMIHVHNTCSLTCWRKKLTMWEITTYLDIHIDILANAWHWEAEQRILVSFIYKYKNIFRI